MKLEIKYKKKIEKHKHVKIKQAMKQRTQIENQKLFWNKWKWKYNFLKLMGYSQNISKREVLSYIGLPQQKNIPNYT